MRISYSGLNTFKVCPYKFKLKYVDGWRDMSINSPLLFGGAVDEAINYILETIKDNKKIDNEVLYKIYTDKMTNYTLPDKTTVNVPTYDKVNYSMGDIDINVLSEEEVDFLSETFSEIDLDFNEISSLTLKDQNGVYKDIRKKYPEVFNMLGWLSLLNKGKKILVTFMNDILPLLDSVVEVQGEIIADNGVGDQLTGYTDFIGKIKGSTIIENEKIFTITSDIKIDSKKTYTILIDNKTTSKPYAEDSVRKSEQLGIYETFRDVDFCAYLAFSKSMPRSGKVNYKFIIDNVDVDIKERAFIDFSVTLGEIEAENFDKNETRETCDYFFGRPCEYRNLCKNNCSKGLYKKDK